MRISRVLGTLAGLLLSAQASAVMVDSAGDSFFINFNGILDPGGGVVVQPGLSASATVTLVSITNGGMNWNFSVTLTNTSSAPVTTSRVSTFGFNSNPDPNVGNSVGGGSFTVVSSGNNPNGLPDSDICFRAGGGGPNCSGGGGGGVTQGNSEMFTFTLAFDAPQTSIDLDAFVIRYQSLMGAQSGSASGVGTISPVPLPGAVWLFLSGLAGLFGMRWRKRRGERLRGDAPAAHPITA